MQQTNPNRQIPRPTRQPPKQPRQRQTSRKSQQSGDKDVIQERSPHNRHQSCQSQKLQNGSIVYELNNPESTQWICKEKAEFTKHYSDSSIIKDKSVSIIVEYVPIAHNPD